MPLRELDEKSIDFLFALMENPGLTISGASLADLAPQQGAPLIATGLLQRHGTANSINDKSYDDAPIAAQFDVERGRFGYLGPSGWIDLPDGAVALYKVDLRTLVLLVAAKLPVVGSIAAAQLMDGLLLDIGDFRLSGANAVSVWFALRCSEREILDAVIAESDKRRSIRTRIVLTTSRSCDLARTSSASCVVLDCRHVRASGSPLAADPRLLTAALLGARAPKPASPLWSSPDGRQLVIHGREEFEFRSDRQAAVIRDLVEAYKIGERVNARALVNRHGGPARSFSQLFGGQKWEALSRYLKPSEAGWYFDL